ncbi:MAG: serine protease [Chloroflexota bacterium]|nr:serine protease [Chloroflexota bacterium]
MDMRYSDRLAVYTQIEKERDSSVLTYVTSDRIGMQTAINTDVIEPFVDLLDLIGPVKRISLILHTNGGQTLAAWRLINLLRMFCDELEVLIPSKALSAGTLMSIGADKIVMTKQAVLGPIDPSINNPLNPQVNVGGQASQVSVSVESVRGYLNLTREELGIVDTQHLTRILLDLSDYIHPVVLGDIFRSTEQIRFLARKLLPRQVKDETSMKSIVDFLCADTGSHDYTIDRREASELGLQVEKPSADLYQLLKEIHTSYNTELQLQNPFSPMEFFGGGKAPSQEYVIPRGLIEGTTGGSYSYVSEGTMTLTQIREEGNPIPQNLLNDNRTFEGWRKTT